MKKPQKEEILREIEAIGKGQYPEEEIAVLGENRKQLFVRIPKNVSKRLNLKKGQKLIFRISNKAPGVAELKVEVMQDEEKSA
jgi:hypothetical protein